ncbi:MAG: hypothetical protein KAH17_06485 [Bacteroidales bacterium]|nr:hypothetical protein [Bacteroidales bacterium]
MSQGKYSEANLAYEYAAFISSDPAEIIQARLGRAQALKKMQAYDRGLEVLETINLIAAPDSLRPAVIYEMVLLSFLNDDYQESLSRGQMGIPFILGTEHESMVYLLLALAALEESNWGKVSAFGNLYLTTIPKHNADSKLHEQFDSLMNRDLPVFKDPAKARKWSTIIPGSGQIYAGSIGDGIYNFGLHAIVLGISGWTFLSGFYVTGWLSGATILQKLHSGGQIRAAELCKKKNRLKAQAYSQPVKEFLISLGKQK